MQKIAHVRPNCEVTVLTNDIPEVPKGQYPYYFLTKGDRDMDIWDVTRRRYKRAIRIFRRRIDAIIAESYAIVPYYRDRDTSELLKIVENNSENPNLPEMLFSIIIKKREDARKENNKKEGPRR